MRRLWCSAIVFTALAAFVPSNSDAQQQTFSMHIGWFSPRGLDGRGADDVLFNNLFNGDYSLEYEINDFRNVTFGVDWLAGIGEYVEVGAGVGAYAKTVSSRYAFLVEEDGSDIDQDLRLRIVPITATIRFLPLGRGAAVEPYVGVGLGVFSWGYSEIGDFVITIDDTIEQLRLVESGWSVGPVVLGGVRFPIGGWSLGGELRYQNASGDLSPDFLGSEIDLTGFDYLATVSIRF